jgi:hypothetical protein
VIEDENPRLKGMLPKDYARPALDKFRLGQLIDLISTIGLGDAQSRSQDKAARVMDELVRPTAIRFTQEPEAEVENHDIGVTNRRYQ